MKFIAQNKGFTLLEILLVIGVLGVLLTFSFSSVGASNKEYFEFSVKQKAFVNWLKTMREFATNNKASTIECEEGPEEVIPDYYIMDYNSNEDEADLINLQAEGCAGFTDSIRGDLNMGDYAILLKTQNNPDGLKEFRVKYKKGGEFFIETEIGLLSKKDLDYQKLYFDFYQKESGEKLGSVRLFQVSGIPEIINNE
jgi:prepilin-type N-terminal cleavage/methylation domain-containing protein